MKMMMSIMKKNIDKSIILTKTRINNYISNKKNSEFQNQKKMIKIILIMKCTAWMSL